MQSAMVGEQKILQKKKNISYGGMFAAQALRVTKVLLQKF